MVIPSSRSLSRSVWRAIEDGGGLSLAPLRMIENDRQEHPVHPAVSLLVQPAGPGGESSPDKGLKVGAVAGRCRCAARSALIRANKGPAGTREAAPDPARIRL